MDRCQVVSIRCMNRVKKLHELEYPTRECIEPVFSVANLLTLGRPSGSHHSLTGNQVQQIAGIVGGERVATIFQAWREGEEGEGRSDSFGVPPLVGLGIPGQMDRAFQDCFSRCFEGYARFSRRGFPDETQNTSVSPLASPARGRGGVGKQRKDALVP